MKKTFQHILLSPPFLVGLFLLILNDFYLKLSFGNFVTGKLSDIAGLFIFPLFFAAFFPSYRKSIYLLTVALFVFWKIPASDPLISYWNLLNIFRIGRTIDYTDLSALLILFVSYYYFGRSSSAIRSRSRYSFANLAYFGVIVTSIFAFTATTYENERGCDYDKVYQLQYEVDGLLEDLGGILKVSQIDVRDDHFDFNSNASLDKSAGRISVFFDVKESFCDSDRIHVFVSLDRDASGRRNLELNSLGFWCGHNPTDEDKAKILELFESEVVRKLEEFKSQRDGNDRTQKQ